MIYEKIYYVCHFFTAIFVQLNFFSYFFNLASGSDNLPGKVLQILYLQTLLQNKWDQFIVEGCVKAFTLVVLVQSATVVDPEIRDMYRTADIYGQPTDVLLIFTATDFQNCIICL